MPEDVAHAEELQLARSVGAQAALEALPVVAGQLGVGPKLLSRLQKEYEEHAAVVMANDDNATTSGLAEKSELVRRVRLGVLQHQRRAVTALRNQNRIDDIVLRELQVELDLQEVQLLDAGDDELRRQRLTCDNGIHGLFRHASAAHR